MKDWQAECNKLRGELAEVRRQLEREQRLRAEREEQDNEMRQETRKFFREIVLDAIGR